MNAPTTSGSFTRPGTVPNETTTKRRVAYLVNQYPKISHAFIRREIAALERLGLAVDRFSVRGSPERLVDPEDLAEASRTRVVLDVGPEGLASAMAREALRSPRRFAEALALATRLGFGSDRGVARHYAYLGEACVLRAWLADAGCEHVHAHFGTNPAAVAMLCRVLGGPPFSFTVHGPEEFDKPEAIRLAEKIERAAFVVGVSEFGRSQLLRQIPHGLWPKVHVVRCGVDASFLSAESTPVPATPRLACIGRLCEQKGQLLLVDAAAALAARGVPFELVLVGDGEMRAAIETSIAKHRLEPHVRITGWADAATIRDVLASSRALVLPSFAEGLPVVIMEALAMGRPVISTYVAGIPELVTSDCGRLVPAGSESALVEAMAEVLAAEPETLSAMGRSGRERVRAMHDVDACAAELADAFASVEAR